MKLLIADDHHLFRDALVSHVIRSQSDAQVLEASTFGEANQIINQHHDIDLVLLDVFMPGMADLSNVADLIRTQTDLPVVLMSGNVDPGLVEKAFACGARGFIPKTMHGKALISVLQMVISGEKYVPDILLNSDAPTSTNEFDLSARELQVLEQLIKGQANKRIAQHLYIEETTVKLHLRSIFKKLGVRNRTEAVIQALNAGIIKE